MTITELADLPADKLEKLSDKELTEILSPFFNVTRPEMVRVTRVKQQEPAVYISPEKRKVLAMLEEEGLDLGFLNKRRKK
jgi:hypothetical protein